MTHRRGVPEGRPLRVMLMIAHLRYGGTERQLSHLARYMDRERAHVEVCCLWEKGPFAELLEAEGVPVHLVQKRARLDPTLPFRLAGLLRRREIDVVHTFLLTAGIWGALAGRLARVAAVVGTERNVDHLEARDRPVTVRLYRLATRFLHDRVLGNSEAVKRYVMQALRLPECKVGVVYNGIEMEAMQPRRAREVVRGELGIGDDAPVVLMAARLHPQKNYPLFLDVAERVRKAQPNVRFVAAGEGPLHAEVERWIEERGLGETVTLLGGRGDVPDLMGMADVVLLTSDWEGFPNTLLEAMTVGRACVATTVGGNDEVVIPGETGELCAPRDADALSTAVVELLKDHERRHRMGQAGRERVSRCFSVQQMVAGTIAEYGAALHVRGSGVLAPRMETARE
jgi:glycosyltransferase involved in cell wall biosynthesis